MAGYVRVDTSNNIADGNVISAADLDNEFDGVQAGFNASTGHTHGGAAGEGAPITRLGPTQDVTINASLMAPKTTNTVDLGTSSLRYKDLFLASNATIAGTLALTGIATFTAQPILSSLTASRAVFTDGAKGLVSNALTGTGNVVMSASPTLTGTISAEALTLSGAVTATGGTANGVAFLNGSKVLTTGSALTFDGTNFKTTGYAKAGGFTVAAGTLTAFDAASGGLYGYYSSGGVLASYSDNSGTLSPLNFDGSYLAWRPAGSEQMRLTSTGLGIGTSSPVYKLVVSNAGASGIEFGPAFSGTANLIQSYNRSGGAYVNTVYDANEHIFNTLGTQRLRLDSSGNLGLGVTPSAWWSSSKAIQIGSNGAPYFSISQQTATTCDGYVMWGARLVGDRSFVYQTSSDPVAAYRQNGAVHAWFNAPSGTAGNAISFTQAATLTASGDFLVGATSAHNFGIPSIQAGGSNANAIISVRRNTTSSADQVLFYNPNGIVGSIATNGSVTTYNVTSDQRLKENIVDAPKFGSVIDSIRVRSYDWKTDQTHQRAGFIAQELVTVAPEAVHQPIDSKDMMAVDYSKLVPMIVKEIQDMRIRLAALEAK